MCTNSRHKDCRLSYFKILWSWTRKDLWMQHVQIKNFFSLLQQTFITIQEEYLLLNKLLVLFLFYCILIFCIFCSLLLYNRCINHGIFMDATNSKFLKKKNINRLETLLLLYRKTMYGQLIQKQCKIHLSILLWNKKTRIKHKEPTTLNHCLLHSSFCLIFPRLPNSTRI